MSYSGAARRRRKAATEHKAHYARHLGAWDLLGPVLVSRWEMGDAKEHVMGEGRFPLCSDDELHTELGMMGVE